MKYAVTDYDGCEYITAGKRYEVISDWLDGFCIIDDENEKLYCKHEECACINGNDWRIIEMNNDIEQQGNDFEVKYDEPWFEVQSIDGLKTHMAADDVQNAIGFDLGSIHAYETPLDAFEGILSGFKDIERLRHEEVEIVRAALQKQPEMSKSDVTRSDIELRDYFAGQALQGMLSNADIMRGVLGGRTKDARPMPEKVSDMACNIATAMMEARK